MMSPSDVYDDQNQQQLYALDKLCVLPGFVKSAALETKDEMRALPTTSFADQSRRKYPCHTKAAAYLSNAYFQKSKGLYSAAEANHIQDYLNKSAAFWNISSLVDTFNDKWVKLSSFDKHEVKEADYALVIDDGDEKTRLMPMPTALAVKAAGDYLFANRHNFTYVMRKTAARNILRKALEYDNRASKGEKFAGAELGVLRFEPDTQDYLERAAGFGASHPAWAAEKIAQRMLLIGDSRNELKVKIAEMAEAVSQLESATPSYFQKLAAVIDAIDRETGLALHYHDGVDMPEEMFFSVLEKEAEAMLDSHVQLQTGRAYPIEAFLSLPLEKISEVLGKDFMEAVQDTSGWGIDPVKFASIAPTLPRDDAALLEIAMNAANEAAHTKEARRAPLMSQERYDKASMIAKFKKEGKRVYEDDYQLTIKAE